MFRKICYVSQMNHGTGATTCDICKKSSAEKDIVGCEVVLQSIQKLIKKDNAAWGPGSRICTECMDTYRTLHIQNLLEEERGDLSALEERVLASVGEHDLITQNINATFEKKLSFGEFLSDRVATFGGSWLFLILFALMMSAWIAFNILGPSREEFDPYPFILLNLILSCLAAIQAPIIMMSQNRQESKDRLRSEQDYLVNMKAELEIRQLHMKMDQLLTHQWQRLLEIQQIQMETMSEVLRTAKGKHSSEN